jgi:pantoate--beta-alanine ligase
VSEYRCVRLVTTIAGVESREHNGRRRALVPTMGALHKAHLKLIEVARERAGWDGEVAVSIFVNPLQFEPGSDFERYPRPEKADEDLCRSAGVDLLFRPDPGEMYLEDRSVFVEETSLSQTLEGKSRPGHFRGVCTVVAKLFNILSPDAAVFGEKDFQQLAIIRRMVRDLNLDVEIIGVPTIREKDGLACSSRNQYLSKEERAEAPVLRKALVAAAQQAKAGEKSAKAIIGAARKTIGQAPGVRIDYVELVDAENLQPRDMVEPNSLLALAVFFGKTRLIDNIRLP